MKGLLLKDWYMMKKYCRANFFVVILFIILSCISTENMFLIFYPSLMCGMIPVNLLAYDERSRWMHYSGTLPYTRAQLVSAKYLIGLFFQVVVLLVTGIVQGVRMYIVGQFHPEQLTVLLMTLLMLAFASSGICLPFVFKLGVEKGRIAYYGMVGIVCAGSFLVSNFLENTQNSFAANLPLIFLFLFILCFYGFSWYLSILFFQNREL